MRSHVSGDDPVGRHCWTDFVPFLDYDVPLDPTGTGRARWTVRWKPVINAFATTFSDRWPAVESY